MGPIGHLYKPRDKANRLGVKQTSVFVLEPGELGPSSFVTVSHKPGPAGRALCVCPGPSVRSNMPLTMPITPRGQT